MFACFLDPVVTLLYKHALEKNLQDVVYINKSHGHCLPEGKLVTTKKCVLPNSRRELGDTRFMCCRCAGAPCDHDNEVS